MSQEPEKHKLRILAETQHVFTGWRVAQKKGEPIPDELWEKALGLLSHFPMKKVAKALRLNEEDLKNRALMAGLMAEEAKPAKMKPRQARAKKKPAKSQFMEMVLSPKVESPQKEAEGEREWRITLIRGDGTRLEIIPPEFDDARMQGLVRGLIGG